MILFFSCNICVYIVIIVSCDVLNLVCFACMISLVLFREITSVAVLFSWELLRVVLVSIYIYKYNSLELKGVSTMPTVVYHHVFDFVFHVS